jgi:hypothetical protein
MPTDEEVSEASSGMRLTRDYLPQLVSAVLKSPPAFQVFPNQQSSSPIQRTSFNIATVSERSEQYCPAGCLKPRRVEDVV